MGVNHFNHHSIILSWQRSIVFAAKNNTHVVQSCLRIVWRRDIMQTMNQQAYWPNWPVCNAACNWRRAIDTTKTSGFVRHSLKQWFLMPLRIYLGARFVTVTRYPNPSRKTGFLLGLVWDRDYMDDNRGCKDKRVNPDSHKILRHLWLLVGIINGD